MTLQVKRCCEESYESNLWGNYQLNKRGTIDLLEDQEYNTVYPDVKYCAYCGKPLELEPTEDTPKPEPYKPDLSSLSPKDRALEELKEVFMKRDENT